MNRIHKQFSLILCSVLFIFSRLSASSEGIWYESYLTSWDSNFQQIAQSLTIPPNSNPQQIVINIAFGNFTFQDDEGIVIGGVGVSMEELQDVIGVLHQKGYLVKMAFGGAGCEVSSLLQSETDATNLADSIAQAIVAFGFDGVDLDIEDWHVDPDLEVDMIAKLRSNLGNNYLISLTVPGNAFWYPVQNAIAGAKGYVDYFNFMEYGITIDPQTSFIQQVLQNLEAYLDTFKLEPNQVVAGFSPVYGDPTSYISVEDLMSIIAPLNLTIRGTMLWSLDLDNDVKLGNETVPFEYTKAMTLSSPF
jgi:hypothetical protein